MSQKSHRKSHKFVTPVCKWLWFAGCVFCSVCVCFPIFLVFGGRFFGNCCFFLGGALNLLHFVLDFLGFGVGVFARPSHGDKIYILKKCFDIFRGNSPRKKGIGLAVLFDCR